MSIYQQYTNYNKDHTPTQLIISCKSLAKNKQKVLRNMVHKAHTQNMFKPEIKLFSPLVYDYMMRISKNRRLSLQTLCVGLYILENFCHCVGYDCEIGMEKLQEVAIASLQISADINQKNCPQIYSHRSSQKNKYRQIKKLKLRILQKLDWQVNYISFISLAELIMDQLKNQLVIYLDKFDNLRTWKQKYCRFDQYMMSQIEIILEQFWFLHLSVKQCAEMLIERVLGNFSLGVEVVWNCGQSGQICQGDNYFILKIWVINKKIEIYDKQQLRSIENYDELNEIILQNSNQRTNKQFFQTSQKNNLKQIKKGCLFSSIKPLKQSNKQQKNSLKSTIINSNQFYNQISSISQTTNSISISILKKNQNENPQILDHSNSLKNNEQSFLMKKTKLCQFRQMVLKNKLSNKYYQVGSGNNSNSNGNTLFSIFNKNKIEENCNSGHNTLLQLSSCKENNNSGMSTRYSSFQ